MKRIKIKCPAKINLTLEIIRKFPNGFHELRSVFLKSDNLFDEVEIVFNDDKKNIEIVCGDKDIPTDEKNIVWKVADEFFKKTGKRTGLRIKIKKHIPVAAGLGGGSSDGAGVLLALNDYFKNPLDFSDLVTVASSVGKDVPFFLQKERAALVGGAGEKIKPIKGFAKTAVLLIKPVGEISTPWAYAELDRKLFFMNSHKRKNFSAELVRKKSDVRAWSRFLYNDFGMVAKDKYPRVEVLEQALLVFGALGASLSGKGPTVFGIFESRKKAEETSREIRKYFPNCFVKLS
jgi:4-diphosphocytidyl-2-C-methyl-D-erythritol kinase